ncbi:hypothetical protein ES703_00243 [subsurface metagenome]
MDTAPFKFLWQVDDRNRAERALVNANATARAQLLENRWPARSLVDDHRIVAGSNPRAVTVALERAPLRLAGVLIQDRDSRHFLTGFLEFLQVKLGVILIF